MENELLINIANKLAIGKPMEIDKWDLNKGAPIEGSGGVNEWQLERLKELGGLNKENAQIIAKYSNQTVGKVEQIFNHAKEIGTEVDSRILSLGIKAGILNEINPIIEDITIKNILEKGISTVLTTFNSQNNSLLTSAGDNYRQIVNSVSSQVLAGTKTTMKAMQEAVRKLAEKGLTGFIARNGANWSPEAYTKMVLRTNTQNTINQIQEERMQLAGNDYVEISQHTGARPLCSQDQGQIFSLSGNTAPIEDGSGRSIQVRAWSTSTYGKPAGILGINCGHSRYAFVPGLSIYRSEPIDKEENDKAYKEKQQQRLYERNIRNKKREIEMLKVTGADESYIKQRRRQLSNYRQEYLEFLDDTGRTRISANEWIGVTKLRNVNNTSNVTKKIISSKINSKNTPCKLGLGEIFNYKGKQYTIDNKNVKYEFKNSELEFANWLAQRTIEPVTLNPKINNPEGIKISDLKIGNEYYDMKIITGGSQQVIYHNVYKKEEQAHNFLFEATKSPLSMKNLQEQANNVFNRKDTGYVQKIGIKKDDSFIILENTKKKQ